MNLDICGCEAFGHLEIAEGFVVVVCGGVEDAEVEPGKLLAGVEAKGFLNEGAGDVWAVEADVGIGPVGERFDVGGGIFAFQLELLGGFVELALTPEQVAEAKVNAGLFGVRMDGIAKLFDGALMVAHLVVGFAGEHVGFGGLGVEGEDLVIDIEHALELSGPEAAVR
ncbi:MAG TPA: hypothetical protein VHZ25_04480 [Acidobacteriaceae bacterium]|nr:hypothetical protein [Acidobacteriaceae bacterium]